MLKPFDRCRRLCIVRTIKEYLTRTEKHYQPPHKAISRDTLARWTLGVLRTADIDVNKYKSHSTRGASASAASRLGVSVNMIMKQASWRNVNSFARFYNKDVEKDPTPVGESLLINAL